MTASGDATPAVAPASALPGRRGAPSAAAVAVFVTFVVNGANVAGWLARLPAVRDQLALDPEQLGLLLLVGALGSLVALPVSGLVVQRLGARATVAGSAVLNAVGLLVAATGVAAGEVLVTGAGLLVFGASIGVWDAAMNLEGAAVEQQLGRSIMPRFHAGFSFGTILGAGGAAVATALHASVLAHLAVVLGVGLLVVVAATRWYLPESEVDTGEQAAATDGAAPRSRVATALAAWREPRTLLIGLVVLAAGLTEGAAGDWLSLAVVDGFPEAARLDNPDTAGAIAFGVFVTAMTTMRLLGTALLDRFGRVAVLRTTAAIALTGLLLFVLGPNLAVAGVGVVLWGLGAALGFPVGMSAAADDPRMAPPRVSVVSTIGYSAFLAGPPLLGLLAQHVGYRQALLAVAVPVLAGLLAVRAAAPLAAAQDDRRSGTGPGI